MTDYEIVGKLVFIDCMEWVDVSRAIYGDPYRVESVKKDLSEVYEKI